MGTVYRITHKASGTTYVGSTNDVKRRWGEHRSRLRHGVHENEHLQRAYNKYGEAAFGWAVLEDGIEGTRLIVREQDYLDEYRERGEVYNTGDCAEAPMRGRNHTEEAKRAMSREFSDEHRRRLSEAHRGKVLPAEQRRKIGDGNRGKVLSEETRRKIASARAKPYPAFIHRETGVIIPAGVDLNAMCERRGIAPQHMYHVKNGQRESHKGWTLLNKEE